MKRNVFMSILLVSMFVCPAVLSKEFEPEDMEMQMQLRQEGDGHQAARSKNGHGARDVEARAGAAQDGSGTCTQ